MSSDKRQFTNFLKFPGSLNTTTGIYDLPKLFIKDSRDRIRYSQIFVRLIKPHESRKYPHGWNLLVDNQLIIKNSYYTNNSVLEGIECQVWQETGLLEGKKSRAAPSFPNAVNIGRANQRNQFQQGLVLARSMFEKKKDKGYSEIFNNTKSNSKIFFPMLAKKEKDARKHLKFPLYVQEKLNGARCLAFLNTNNYKKAKYKDVVLYSRQGKLYSDVMDYLRKDLFDILEGMFDIKNNVSVYLDGELYKKGKKLQDITGESRRETKTNISNLNEYHIYDIFYPDELDMQMTDRLNLLNEAFKCVLNSKYLFKVKTTIHTNWKTINKLFKHIINKNGEGLILRNMDGVYKGSCKKASSYLRSNDVVKMKAKYSGEYELVGYTQGDKGKDIGAIIWICENTNGKKFNVTPKDITYKERYKLFTMLENNPSLFIKKYKNRMIMLEWEELSKDSIPQRAKALDFRDHL